MNSFTQGFNKNSLFVSLIKISTWTLVHVGVLYLLLYLDNNFILPEWMLGIISIPVGLINCGLLLTAFRNLGNLHWNTVLNFIAVCFNFIFYLSITFKMFSQSGAIIN